MPDVELRAIKDFSYATRRLKAGDTFTVTAPLAKVLIGIKKAELPRVPGRVAAPPAAVMRRAETVTPPPEAVASGAVGAISTLSVRTDPLDHDGDGKPGGSRKGARRRPRTAKKG